LRDLLIALFISAEVLNFTVVLAQYIGKTTRTTRAICPLDALQPPLLQHERPRVQVLITTYSEPVELVRRTLEGAMLLDYPPDRLEINVLDDGFFSIEDAARGVAGFKQTERGGAMMLLIEALAKRASAATNGPTGAQCEHTSREVDGAARPDAAPHGSLVLEQRRPNLPTLRLIARRKGVPTWHKVRWGT
jgi:cellulose synthase/poly-beta-1,6-N-acetylglucosamine synthase-like glycosyltransferase